jgi:hypothetical protein
MWVIEDELHSEHSGEFSTEAEAIAELRRRAEIPWDEEPNQAPCMSWQRCGRRYELVEYDVSTTGHWKELRRLPVLNISREESSWLL